LNVPKGSEVDIEFLSEPRSFTPRNQREGDRERFVIDVMLHSFIGPAVASVRVQQDGQWVSEKQTPKAGTVYTFDVSSKPMRRGIMNLFNLWDEKDYKLKGLKLTVWRKPREGGAYPTYEVKHFVDREAQKGAIETRLASVHFSEDWVRGVCFLKDVANEWTVAKVKPILVSNFERDFSDDEVRRVMLEVAKKEGAGFDGEILRF